MAMNRTQRLRRLTDLFVTGKAVKMPDDTHLWVQAINDYQRDEAINDAQIARARIVLALKEDGRERLKIQGRLAEMGHDALIRELARSKADNKAGSFIDEMRSDEEWKERVEIILNTNWDEEAKPATEEETLYLAKINKEVLEELAKREGDEFDFQERRLSRLTDEELVDEWIDEWLENRGNERATAEYQLTELYYATRFCEASADGTEGEANDKATSLDHSRCDSHREMVFADKSDARNCPSALATLLKQALADINVGGRDPKGSASQPVSSATSAPPSEPGESTPSTSTETPAPPPGTSPKPSATD